MFIHHHKEELLENGFTITESLFSDDEIKKLSTLIDDKRVIAIRQLANKHPKVIGVLFENKKFKELYSTICKDYFLCKAIYFNKPKNSNWFVNYHQDISISVRKKESTDGYSKWTFKDNQFGVVPPKHILENIVTFRIHLDKTDSTNGALSVIPNSHNKGLIRIDETFSSSNKKDELCNVEKGAVMLMKPLLLHASKKSTSDYDRRVIHLEFSNCDIPMGWLEKKVI